MLNILKQHRVLALVLSFLLVFTLFLLSIINRGANNPTGSHVDIAPSQTEPTPLEYSDQYYKRSTSIQRKESIIGKREEAVSQLRKSLPYTGKYFSMKYDISNNSFNVVLDQANISLANRELDAFLIHHTIQERTWFRSLKITSGKL